MWREVVELTDDWATVSTQTTDNMEKGSAGGRRNRFSALVSWRLGQFIHAVLWLIGESVIKERMNLHALFNETVRTFGNWEGAVCCIKSTRWDSFICEWDVNDTDYENWWQVIAFVLQRGDVFCQSLHLEFKVHHVLVILPPFPSFPLLHSLCPLSSDNPHNIT